MKITCIICGKERKAWGAGNANKYCSLTCFQVKNYNDNVEKWLKGEDKGWSGKTATLKNFVRKYIHLHKGTACEECGWDKKHPLDGRVLTEIDHIDGDAHNCKPENLRVLCPNCHSMTPTHRARNKSSKRTRYGKIKT